MIEALKDAGVPHARDEPLAGYTSMGVGGAAALMAFPRTPEELRRSLQARAELGVPHRILGGGSNLVVADQGLDELIVSTRRLRQVQLGARGRVTAHGGANLIGLVTRCGRAGWSGLQRAVGIPGSVGGATVMNAGAYGFSISDVLCDVLVYDGTGRACTPPGGWRFDYRASSIPVGAAVASVDVQLEPGDARELVHEMRTLQLQRRRGQPLGRSAGCVFKNPPGAHAGRLIDEAGLKGVRIGAAVVSTRHANFVVNEGGARAADVLALLDLVRSTVARRTGVELELEVQVWSPAT